MRIRQRAYLGVSSEELAAETISDLIGLDGDRLARRGSRSTDPPLPIASAWYLDATADRPIDAQIGELLDRIEPVADRIGDLVSRDDVHGRIAVVRHLGHPDGEEEELRTIGDLEKLPGQHQLLGFALEAEVLGRLVDLGLDLDVDEYG